MVLNTKKYNFGSQEWSWFHFWFIMAPYYKMRQILLQNATTILLHCGKSLLQNMPGFLLQNVTVLLQNATFITKYIDFITKCGIYYKMR